jgi:hypothetical protein
MKSKHATKPAKSEQGLLLNVARTIGSTLGTLAAKTGGVTKRSSLPARAKKTRSKKSVKGRKRRSA